MANKNYYSHGKTKKGAIGVIVAITASALLLGAAAGVMGYGTNGFKDWSFNNFTHKSEYTIPDDREPNGSAVISEVKSHGISLMSARIASEDYEAYGISPLAENAQVITATFTPAATTNQNVTWSVDGGDGKVSVAAVTGNRLQATVTVTGGFATRATITCTSEENSAIKATATVDYVKMPKMNLTLSDYDDASIKNRGAAAQISDFEIGTVSPTLYKGTYDISMDYDLYTHLKAIDSRVLQITSIEVEFSTYSENLGFNNLLAQVPESERDKIYQAVAAYYYGQTEVSIAEYSLSYLHIYYDTVEVGFLDDCVYTQNYIINGFSDIIVRAQSVAVDKNSFVFGPNGLVK